MPDAQLMATLTAQLGRRPMGVVGVAAACPAGHPCVVVNHPLRRRDGRVVPFPTLHWLTCPEASRRVACLERDGAISRIERMVRGDPALMARLAGDHRACVAARWAMLNDDEKRRVEQAGLTDLFNRRGIGGTADWTAITCLHAHYAHHLALGGVIGEILETELGVRLCGGGVPLNATTA